MPVDDIKPTRPDQEVPPVSEDKHIVSQGGERSPHLPHDRDESVSSQHSAPRQIIEQARRDTEAGLLDADVSPPMDALYKREFRQAEASDASSGPTEEADATPTPLRGRSPRAE